VAGDRVGVQQRRLTIPRRAHQEAGVEGGRPVASGDRQHAPGGIDSGDPTPIAVVDPTTRIVALHDHSIPDRELPARKRKLRRAEPAALSELLTSELVELADVDATVGDHDGVPVVGDRNPIAHERVARLRLVGLDCDQPMLGVVRDCLIASAVAQLVERLALPSVHLADVVAELDRDAALDESAERAAGPKFGKLAMVADENELAARVLHVIEQLRQISRRHRPGLVDDQHAARRQAVDAESNVVKQRGDARALDARSVAQLRRGSPRHRDAEHGLSAPLPCLARGRQSEGLARTGLAGDDRNAIAVEADPLDERPLVVRQSRATTDRPPNGQLGCNSGACVSRVHDAVDETLLERELLRSRIEDQLAARRHQPPVTAAEALRRCRLAGNLRHDVIRRQELISSSLESLTVRDELHRQQLAQRLDDVPTRERRTPVRQPLGKVPPQRLKIRAGTATRPFATNDAA
jgi:hypothetical protein